MEAACGELRAADRSLTGTSGTLWNPSLTLYLLRTICFICYLNISQHPCFKCVFAEERLRLKREGAIFLKVIQLGRVILRT